MAIRLEGYGVAANGRINCLVKFELRSEAGQLIASAPSTRVPTPVSYTWNGKPFTYSTGFTIPTECAAGNYVVSLRVSDQVTGKSSMREMAVTIADRSTFAALRLQFSHDESGEHPAGACVSEGSTVFLRSLLAGYEIQNDRMNARITATVMNDDGGRLLPEPIVINVDRKLPYDGWVSADEHRTAWKAEIPCLRAGEFRVHLLLEDLLGRREAIYEVPLRVVASAGLPAGTVMLQAAAERSPSPAKQNDGGAFPFPFPARAP